MLVGVLISIMISIVVGVNLIPSIVESINTAKGTANAPTGMSGLLDVLVYVGLGVLMRRLVSATGQIRGSLREATSYGNLELNPASAGKCVETRGSASLGDGGIVQPLRKTGRVLLYRGHTLRGCSLDWGPNLNVVRFSI